MDGTEDDIRRVSKALIELKQKIPNVEFIVTTDKMELRSVKYLIDELYILYQKQKQLFDMMSNNEKNEQ